jgi:predicted GH43/DUF377 family glycosyl hydrolase
MKPRSSHRLIAFLTLPTLGVLLWATAQAGEQDRPTTETAAGWVKSPKNPVLGGDLGTCFDVSVLKEGGIYRMWFSWRPKKSIALVESKDGIEWSKPLIVLGPNDKTDWEGDINRPVVIKHGGLYRMWYTGQARGKSWIGYATSEDGKSWHRESDRPVLSADKPWEKVAVMCPHVLFDEKAGLYRMWYSGGEQYEPDAIGHATSKDGLAWVKHEDNPVFRPDPSLDWEKDRVTACQVIRQADGYLMFYIGFRDRDHAQIGVARSKDGIANWQRHPANPFIRPGVGKWDQDAVYKPYTIFDGQKWLLWYNGRRGGVEQIGLATHEGEDLGFSASPVREQPSKKLPMPGEVFEVGGHTAFLIMPKPEHQVAGMPWVWYAPTLTGLPGAEETWMFQKFLDSGIAIAGIDVGESYGSPDGRAIFTSFYRELVGQRRFSKKPCLLARSRGGLMLYNWAVEHPESVGCIAGIYPVCDLRSYPGIDKASRAYGMTPEELRESFARHNPVDRVEPLAKSGVPVLHIHGDVDTVVPLELNSAELARRYRRFGGEMTLTVIKGQGHNMWPGWFQCQELVDFVIAHAKPKD